MKTHVSPRELAAALGVSESSLKRWADDGRIAADRTVGGHRRIPLAEAIRFVRGSGVPIGRPELLGLGNPVETAAIPPPEEAAAGVACERLHELLLADDAAAARGWVASLYLAGWPIETICDGPVRNALTWIGEQWRHGPAGIFQEHRATQTTLQALGELRPLLPPAPRDAPVALGCAPAGDPYSIPSRAAALVLASAGFREVDLGPDTPVDALMAAIDTLRPAVVWLACSVDAPGAHIADRELGRVVEAAGGAGGVVIVGGRAAPSHRSAAACGAVRGASMAELAAFARGRLSGAPA
jgi:excisionase family DNA binding protein